MANRSQHKESTRNCPGCKQKKTFPIRNETCSAVCKDLLRAAKNVPAADPLETSIAAFLSKAKNTSVTLESLCEQFDRSKSSIEAALTSLRAGGANVHIADNVIAMPSQLVPGNVGGVALVHDISEYSGGMFQFGALGDNHLGSKHERLDVLTAAYDLYEREGVKVVFNTGNWIEGEMRLNFHDVKVHGLDAQIDYMLDNYPHKPGIITYFVAGDDHEGWYQRNSRLEIGRLLQLRAEEAGRFDLKYLGYVEADVILKSKKGQSLLKVMHPGGGSSYAHSYAPQKIVESMQGGEKPQVLLIGHYHKFEYCFPREVHVVQTGCTVDQSIFMRKCKIQAMVGFTLCRLNQADNGVINRFQVEWFPFYDRGFYKKRRDFGLAKTPPSSLLVERGKIAA